ncbi:MAG: ParB/RepB/Spo0J family partition protein [Prosthecobacter sp.]|uniref:ParB/RepB/Spo0J family partition protein n=1 Tax=Prosthecobacter sp. TaxID=1965333 RepID=UPI00390236B4
MTKLPEGKSRLDLVKSGLTGGLPKRGRFIVSIDRLQEDPNNERKVFHNMDDMIESVRRHGIIEPITVTQDGDHYRILTGHRRFRAAKAVGLTELEVIVRESDDQITRRFKSLISNIQRENIPAIELAETLRTLLDSGAVATQRELAAQIGKSEQWMSGMLRILELPARLQEELRHTPGIGYEVAQRIAQVDDSQFQEELVAAAAAGESTPSIRARITNFRTRQDSEQTRKKKSRTSNMIQLSHREGNCTASLRAKREPGAREAMLEALRQLTQQVRGDDSLR